VVSAAAAAGRRGEMANLACGDQLQNKNLKKKKFKKIKKKPPRVCSVYLTVKCTRQSPGARRGPRVPPAP